jgi:hypothetical protein
MYWKRRLKRSGERWDLRLRFAFIFAALLLGVCGGLRASEKVKELQDHFDHEPHAGGKVKALNKLADAQFEAATKAGSDGDYVAVGLILEKYRDNVRTAFNLLKKQEPDADRHPNNYRQLELEVRKGIREVEETIVVVPAEVRPPLQIVRQDLINTDDALIALLFPRRTKDPTKVPPVPEAKP